MATEQMDHAAVSAPSSPEPGYLEEDQTRPSNPEDFPNFRDFQIVKMVKHFRVITDGSQEQLRLGFKCKTCGVAFNKTMQLLGHIRLHFEYEHTCRECGKYFFDPNKLQIHIKAKHTVPSTVKCHLGCHRFFTTSYKSLQLHYDRFHFVKMRLREVRRIDETIRDGGTVMTELLGIKPKRKRVRARIEQLVPSSGEEESQESMDAVPRPEANAQPQVTAAEQQNQPSLHELGEEDAEQEEVDNLEDSAGASVAVAVDQHAEDDRVYDHMQCCVCGAIFGNEQQLELHENSHTNPFECSFCSVAFASLADIRVHYQSKHQMAGKTPQFVITNSQQPQIQQHPAWHIVQNQHQLQQQQQHQQQQHQQQQQQQQQIQQHQQQQIQQCAPTAQFIPSAANGAMTTMLVMQNGMLIPVHAIDSAQLAAVNPYQQQATATTLTPIAQNTQIAWPITATPITTNHHHQHHQLQQQSPHILPPVQNQIEIIPLHGPAPGTSTTPHGLLTAIAPAPQHQHQQTLTPVQLSLKDASGNVIGGGGGSGGNSAGGGYVINSIASIDPSYLKQIDPVLHQQQQQQQQQHQQLQQQQLQQHQQQLQQQQQQQQQLHQHQQYQS